MADRVGIRELKNRVSYYLRRADAGERISVTDGGREIVAIVPSPEDDLYRRLRKLAELGVISWSGKRPYIPTQTFEIAGKPISETILEGRE